MIQPLRSARTQWALDWHEVATPVFKDGIAQLPTCLFVIGEEEAQLVGSEILLEMDQRRAESFLARLFGERGAPDELLVAAHPDWTEEAWLAFAEEFRVTLTVAGSAQQDTRGLLRLVGELKQEMAARLVEPERRLAANQEGPVLAEGLMATAQRVQSPAKREQLLRAAIACDPECVAALLALGEGKFHGGEMDKALEFYVRVHQIEERRWRGSQKPGWWADRATRPYMKSLFGQMFVLWHMGKLEEAAEFGERLLRTNPDDHQGIRFLLPMLHLLAGHHDQASAFYSHYETRYPGDYPEPAFLFGWGLVASRADDESASIRRYSEGMLKNIHIAPLLLDLPSPSHELWHPNDRAEPNYAYEFFDSFAILWERDRSSLRALREVYEHNSERLAEVVALRMEMADFQDQRYDPKHEENWKALLERDRVLTTIDR